MVLVAVVAVVDAEPLVPGGEAPARRPETIPNFATVRNDHLACRYVIVVCRHALHTSDDFHTLDHLPEDNVLSVEVMRGRERDEELRRVGVLPAVCHREEARVVVIMREAYIRDRNLAHESSCSCGNPTSEPDRDLAHESS